MRSNKTPKSFTLCTFILIVFSIGCKENKEETEIPFDSNYRDSMRSFVIGISEYGKSFNPAFVIIPQNGIELVTMDGESNGPISSDYINAIDGHGQEDLFFGYYSDDEASPSSETSYIQDFLDISTNLGNTILTTDYCFSPNNVDNSYLINENNGYISFAAPARELNVIPEYPAAPNNENTNDISELNDVKNFLYLINPSEFATKESFIDAVISTNYDLLIVDLFFHDGTIFNEFEITQLKEKSNGSQRMVIAYMSIGEAEEYRYYWQNSWSDSPPSWLSEENPDWPGNYKVKYWENEWQYIVFGNNDSYLKKIVDAGFDGVYLDIIDAFEYFE